MIKHWVETQFYDFDDDLIEELFGFVDSTLFNAGHTAMAQALHEKLNTKLKDRKKRLAAMISVPPTDLMVRLACFKSLLVPMLTLLIDAAGYCQPGALLHEHHR